MSITTASQWETVKEIFDQVVDLPEPARNAALNAATSDSVVLAEVRRLLSAWGPAESWFHSATIAVSRLASAPAYDPGDVLAERYRIVRYIARGGMGEVYEAEDQVLSGSVALKILRPSLILQEGMEASFRNEIQLSRTISSPHVCRVHDIEHHIDADGARIPFYTMELLAGETLSTHLRSAGPLTLKQARPIIRSIALGLDAAHRLGIAHRDLKPGNVILTPAGAVIMDFGLARNSTRISDGIDGATPAYAAPEQLEGRTESLASDVYSFGVILHELLTGKVPEGSISQVVPSVVVECLREDPATRPKSALAVAEKLGALRDDDSLTRRALWMLPVGALGVAAYKMWPVHSGSPQPLIGITPFTAAGADAVYLSEGVSDRIADLLSRVPGLKVLAKSSVLRFRQLGYPTAEFRKRLGVDYVLSGQLTGNGQRIRLAVQLTPADQSAQLWSTTIESDSGVVEASAGAIARSLIRVLKLENASASLANTSLTANPQALQAYLLGRYHAERRDPESLRDSVRMLERAIELDAGFSAAHAALAMSRYYAAPKDHSNTRRVIEASLDAAATALRLDPGNAEAYLAIGAANYLFLWNWPTSDLNLVKAVAFNPSYATAHHIRANFLAAVNRLPEARQAIDTAMELDPLSNIIKTARGSILLKNGQAEDAVAQYRAVLAEDPSFVNARNQLAGALVVLGRWDQALQESSLSVKTAKRASFALAQYGYLTAKIGSRSEAVAIVTELSSRYLQHQSQPSFVAQVLLGLGETAQAIVWLEKGVADMDPNLTGLRTGSMFSELHSYPEFQNLLTQLKL